jgi:hypothetical protein
MVNVVLGCWAKEYCTGRSVVGIREGEAEGMMCAAWKAERTLAS